MSNPRVPSPLGPPVENPRPKTSIAVESRPKTPLIVQPAAPKSAGKSENQTIESNGQTLAPPGVASTETRRLDSSPLTFDAKTRTQNNSKDGKANDVALLTNDDQLDKSKELTDFDVIFVGDVPPELECKVCSQVLRIPQKLPCGHLFCLSCCQDISECLVCGKKFDAKSLREDKPTARQIQQLPVKCSFSDNGCEWQGVLKELKAHAVACEFADTICPRGCGEVFARKDESTHLTMCSRKTVLCVNCGKEVSERSMKTHLKVCPSMIIDCPNRCGLMQKPRSEIHEHLESCPKNGSVCPFGEFGCDYTDGRENLQQHIKSELTAHLGLLCAGVLEFRELVSAAFLNLEKMTRNTNILQSRIDALEKLYGSQYIWRIDEYARKFAEAKSGQRTLLFSPPFLSGRHGYKLVLCVGLFGDGPAHGQFLSIYVCILKGDHDALLSWPFVHMITLTVMDQNPKFNERKHLTYAIKPQPTNENRAYLQRPENERNFAFGAQKFCSLAEIQPFIREDVLFIKCKIDTENMIVL
ncbi:Trf-1 [Aphelenchoides besseyi]|nr:Trf-1 [Aphelenchoides besseyi]